eukprot:5655410-Lingulodinium_polyedra.AAC.1
MLELELHGPRPRASARPASLGQLGTNAATGPTYAAKTPGPKAPPGLAPPSAPSWLHAAPNQMGENHN